MNRNEVSAMVQGWEKAILSMSKAAEETASSKSSSSESTGASREELKEMIQCLEKTAKALEKIAGIIDLSRIAALDPEESEVNRSTDNGTKVPIWRKTTLSISEASALSGIGLHKLYEMTENKDCNFVIWNGSKRLFKRKQFEEYLEKAYSI